MLAHADHITGAVANYETTGQNKARGSHEVVHMTRPLVFSDLDDLVSRYREGISLKQLAEEAGCSRGALGRALTLEGVRLRSISDAKKIEWRAAKRTPGGVEKYLRRAWEAADARNDEIEHRILSLYRAGLTSSAAIARRLQISKPTVGGILRKNGICRHRMSERRANGNLGGFNPAMQCAFEADFAGEFTARGLDYIHQAAIGTRNLDFTFHAERVAVEIVRRHWNDAKSLRKQRLEQILRCGLAPFHRLRSRAQRDRHRSMHG